MSELVREIVEVAAMVGGDADDPLLIVEADGLAPTAGWTHVRLEPHFDDDDDDDARDPAEGHVRDNEDA